MHGNFLPFTGLIFLNIYIASFWWHIFSEVIAFPMGFDENLIKLFIVLKMSSLFLINNAVGIDFSFK